MPRTICCAALDQGVQLLVGADVEVAKPAEILGQVGDRRIAEDFALTLACAQPFGQMLDQLGEFGDKRLLGQAHGLLEAGRHACLLLLVDGWIELHR